MFMCLVFYLVLSVFTSIFHFGQYITLHSLDPTLVKMTVGCGISHTISHTITITIRIIAAFKFVVLIFPPNKLTTSE
jgi:hypothetical protein